jgi:hypothetical protein
MRSRCRGSVTSKNLTNIQQFDDSIAMSAGAAFGAYALGQGVPSLGSFVFQAWISGGVIGS